MALPPILYEDDAMIAFDKPAGMPVVSAGREQAGREALMDGVRGRYGAGVASVHRLDAEASGVLLCAKTKPAVDFLSGQFQAKTVESRYLALVVVLPPEKVEGAKDVMRGPGGGLPEEFIMELGLMEDAHQAGRMRVDRKRSARPAVTELRVRESFGRFVLVECRPLTSRPHQIRVHLAAAGAPVLNDGFYGEPEVKLLLSELKRHYKGREEERPLIERLALHASELTLTHPLTRERVTVSAPEPKDFVIALKYLRKFGAGRR